MIYLITGNMGTGKTSKVVSMILNNEDGLFKMKLEDGTEVPRPLYFCHIDGLNKEKFKAKELTEEQIQSAPLNQLVPTGSVVIVDECDYAYPTRSAGREVPPYIKTLKELRHEGYTLILMTQHPMMIDPYLRNLVSKHIHLERKPIGMKQYWWYKAVTSLENPAAVTGVQSASWKPPKDAFKYYKSSSQHLKFKKNIPLAVYALVAIFVLIAWKGYGVYDAYKRGTGQVEAETSAISSDAAVSPASSSMPVAPSSAVGQGQSLTPDLYVPTLAEKPESKPLYDSVRQVKTYERIAACIAGGKSGCTCYSDQATPLKEITAEMCKDYVKNGLPFNPYKDPANAQNAPSESSVSPASQGGSVTVLNGENKYTI